MPASALVLRLTGIYKTVLLKKNGSSVDEVQVNLTNAVKFDSEIKELKFEGDGQELTTYNLTAITAELTSDTFDLAALTTIMGISTVTTGIPVSESERAYLGTTTDQAGVTCGLAVYATAVDQVTSTNKKIKIVLPVGSLSTFVPPEMKSADKASTNFKFSASRTSVDMAGTALPSVPAGGCFYYYAVLV